MAKLRSNFSLFLSLFFPYICLISHVCLLSAPFFAPLFVLITTKPCRHSGLGHVNLPGQHHLFPAVYLQPNKGVCLFVVAGEECCVGWGLLFNSARCHQPPTLKRPIQHRESMQWERREDVNVGVVGYSETISNLSLPEEPRQTGHKRRHITGKREEQINSCASSDSLFRAQVYAGAVLQGGGGSVCVSRGGLAGFGRSSKVSFASANETEPGWSMSPWQQAISTSLSAIIAAALVCLLVSLHPASPPSRHSRAHHLTGPIGWNISLNLSLTPSEKDTHTQKKTNLHSVMKDECRKLLWASQRIRVQAKNWQP